MASKPGCFILGAEPSGRGGDVLLIIPPFARVHRPSLGVHLLQACGQADGFQVRVWYGSLALAGLFGLEYYNAICDASGNLFMGERLFAASAYGLSAFGRDGAEFLRRHTVSDPAVQDEDELSFPRLDKVRLTAAELIELEATARRWVDDVASTIAAYNFRLVGSSTMFDQTAASLALLHRIKRLRPEIVTLIGGPNCEGEMAEGIATLTNEVDFIFSGESEATFRAFLTAQHRGQLPGSRIIRGQPCANLDALPTPTFREYYEQLEQQLPDRDERAGEISLVYETSRGCWWGEKHHCTFCGLNGAGMTFRKKSPGKIINELQQLLPTYPWQRVQMTDNIMPYSYFHDLLPVLATLASTHPTLKIFYEQKANLSLQHVLALMQAGITHIQPGIEALSTSLLKRMKKGVTASQNIALLRYARAVDMTVWWNLLWGIPGDDIRDYEDTLALLPLLRHLCPPSMVAHVSIDRFSPYFEHPADYGVKDITPWPGFAMILPPGADPSKVAYHFYADYDSASRRRPDLMRELQAQVEAWQQSWNVYMPLGTVKVPLRPTLEVLRGTETFTLVDTRGLPDTDRYLPITRSQAAAALLPRRASTEADLEWALHHRVGVMLDAHSYVPLATAKPEILHAFEKQLLSREQLSSLPFV